MTSLRIFMVEDHADTARGLKRFLQAQGHRVILAENVSSALQLAEKHQFDVLLSDLGLPDGNGWDLLQELRTRTTGPVRAIAMSGYNSDADLDRSNRVGFMQHLAKPLRLDVLMAALRAATAR